MAANYSKLLLRSTEIQELTGSTLYYDFGDIKEIKSTLFSLFPWEAHFSGIPLSVRREFAIRKI